MLKRTKFSPQTKSNRRALKNRITYMSDVTHQNHINKRIAAGRNYLCEDNGEMAFETKALELFEKYKKGREGREGKRTNKLFEEHIYSSSPGALLTDSEKNFLEKSIIENGFPDTPVRTVWHDDIRTGRADLHILSAGYTDGIPPRCHLSTDFGHGKRHFLLTLELAERDALDEINLNREPSKQIKSAREAKEKTMKEKGILTLPQKLSGKWDGENETLPAVLTKLGYTINRFNEKTVTVRIGDGKLKKYNLETLRDNLEEKVLEKKKEQERIPSKLSREEKIAKWQKKFGIEERTPDVPPLIGILEEDGTILEVVEEIIEKETNAVKSTFEQKIDAAVQKLFPKTNVDKIKEKSFEGIGIKFVKEQLKKKPEATQEEMDKSAKGLWNTYEKGGYGDI